MNTIKPRRRYVTKNYVCGIVRDFWISHRTIIKNIYIYPWYHWYQSDEFMVHCVTRLEMHIHLWTTVQKIRKSIKILLLWQRSLMQLCISNFQLQCNIIYTHAYGFYNTSHYRKIMNAFVVPTTYLQIYYTWCLQKYVYLYSHSVILIYLYII